MLKAKSLSIHVLTDEYFHMIFFSSIQHRHSDMKEITCASSFTTLGEMLPAFGGQRMTATCESCCYHEAARSSLHSDDGCQEIVTAHNSL